MDDDDDSIYDENNHDDADEREDASFKSFHLLNALSDLMMLPKDMLLSKSVRKEVQPWVFNHLILSLCDQYF